MRVIVWLMTSAVTSALLAGPVSVRVTGWPFEIGELRDGAKAYMNRDYVWENVPEALRGWRFTRLNGGVTSRITAVPDADGELYLAIARGSTPLPGWRYAPQWRFNYSDQNKTIVRVFSKKCRVGRPIAIPQGNWTGGILLAPKMTGKPTEPKPDHSRTPGVVIDHSPAVSMNYIGCPSIVVLTNGHYVASHSFFGKGNMRGKTRVFRSKDGGKTWEQRAELVQSFSNLFQHRGALYLMGVGGSGAAVIRRSDDEGATWTAPKDGRTGVLLPERSYHSAPVPVVIHSGRLWRAMEDRAAGGGWPAQFRAFIMSAPVDADLLDASNWTVTNRLARTGDWPDREYRGWLEGNAVVAPDGTVVNVLRIDSFAGGKAAVIRVSEDGKTSTFDPATGFLNFPGGAKKFTIRFDPTSKLYWSLTNPVDEGTRAGLPACMVRNTLALIASAELDDWRVRSIVLKHPDPLKHAFQYVDWQFDGDDVVFVSRTAYDDGLGGARNAHDANYFTFHRIKGFRRLRRGPGMLLGNEARSAERTSPSAQSSAQ